MKRPASVMTVRGAPRSGRRGRVPAPLLFALGFTFALVQAGGCSTSGASSDGAVEGGHGGAGGMSSGGTSGESGHPGTGGAAGSGSGGFGGDAGNAQGGASGGAGGVAGKAAGGTSGSGSGGSAGKGSGGSGGKGAGGAGGSQMFSCGSDTCTAGESYCYTYTPGTAGQTGRSCQTTPAACASMPTSCACLCPTSGTGPGCVPVGMGAGNYCTCSVTGGAVNIVCAGV